MRTGFFRKPELKIKLIPTPYEFFGQNRADLQR